MAHRDKIGVPAQDFIERLKEQAREYSPIKGAEGIDVGPLGSFPYYYVNVADNVFRDVSRTYFASGVVPVSSGESYSLMSTLSESRYLDYIRDTTFELSGADQEALAKARLNSQSLMGQLIKEYEAIYKEITDAQMAEAGQTTKIDYIFHRVQTWSSKPLNLVVGDVADLTRMLDKLPASGKPLLPTLSQYVNSLSSVLPIINAQGNGNHKLSKIQENITRPSAENGGVKTVDASGKTRYRPAYDIRKSAEQIWKELTSPGAGKVTVSMSASSHAEGEANVSVQGGAIGALRWASLVLIATADAQYTLDTFASKTTKIDINLETKGLSSVEYSPRPLSSDANDGWFEPTILQQAVANHGKDKTGFHLRSYDPNVVAETPFHTGLVLGTFPSVQVTYFDAEWNKVAEKFAQSSKVRLTIFGIPLFSAGSEYGQASLAENSEVNGFTVAIPAPKYTDAPTLNDQQVFVMGAKVIYPFQPSAEYIPEARHPEEVADLSRA